MVIDYTPRGVCSRKITIEVDDDGTVQDVKFYGGCHGNAQGISALVKGMKANEVIKRLENIRCGSKQTSCPDQLAKALKCVLNREVSQ
jgi:uncharacterized protein (TIGR03905 family)